MSAFAQESKELTTLVAALSTKGTDADACAASVAKTLAASPAAFVGVAAALEVVFAEKLVEAKLGALKVVQAVTAATGASTAPLLVAFLPHVFAMYVAVAAAGGSGVSCGRGQDRRGRDNLFRIQFD